MEKLSLKESIMTEVIREEYDLSEVNIEEKIDIEIEEVKNLFSFEHKEDDIEGAFHELCNFYEEVTNCFKAILGVNNLDFCSKNGKMVVTNYYG
jgi:hypothetical protein